MNKPLYDFFTADHKRLDALFEQATKDPDNIDMDAYHQFRVGLLKHIKMEERILFPAAKKANNNVPLPLQSKLRKDHGALTALMVVSPNANWIKIIHHILEIHDKIEEEEGGMYEICESLTSNETDNLLEQLRNTTEVPVHPHNDSDIAVKSAKNALKRAGFDYDEMVKGCN